MQACWIHKRITEALTLVFNDGDAFVQVALSDIGSANNPSLRSEGSECLETLPGLEQYVDLGLDLSRLIGIFWYTGSKN